MNGLGMVFENTYALLITISAKTVEKIVFILTSFAFVFASGIASTSVFSSEEYIYSVNDKKINIEEFIDFIANVDLNTQDSNLDRIIKIPKYLLNRFNWVDEACVFLSDEQNLRDYGSFPEMNEEFHLKLVSFEMRLCTRVLAQRIDKADVIYAGVIDEFENRILDRAEECGYNNSQDFPSYAAGYLILGRQDFEKIDGFVCGDYVASPDYYHEIDFVLNVFVVKYIYMNKIFGDKVLADKYFAYEKRVIENRKREFQEYLATPEGQKQLQEMQALEKEENERRRMPRDIEN
ncbi:hypothetical protein [Denitrobaculum tricleocarpae]|uniref:Uncharacterized protein n=1 Tax=Denitrobaculum tricleocarpae TaxID=2591009 RepID=A0A545TU44_9PROT|nr:hypothetical protein [Denitrobaculum tricleocarpae]TQV80736.1 hypothetical protein FKG95_11315 [Denitrobaculum tricleocarpae]